MTSKRSFSCRPTTKASFHTSPGDIFGLSKRHPKLFAFFGTFVPNIASVPGLAIELCPKDGIHAIPLEEDTNLRYEASAGGEVRPQKVEVPEGKN